MSLQPPDGCHECAGRVPVRFVSPCLPYVQGFVMITRLRNHGPERVLPPVHEEGLESPVIVHPVPQIVGRVHRRRRVKAMAGQYLRQGGYVRGQRLPSHKGHCPASRLVVRPGGHGRESGGVVPVEPGRPGRQRIQGGCSDRLIAVSAYVVLAKGVRNNPDDIQYSHSCEQRGMYEFITRLGNSESFSQVSGAPQSGTPRRPGVGFCGVPSAIGLTGRSSPGRFHCQVGREADYIARVKVMVKVLDFVKSGGPDLTVGSTIFEMWMAL